MSFSLNPVTDFLNAIASDISNALVWAIQQLGSAIQNNTSVTVGARYAALLRLDARLAAFVGVFVLLFAGARAALSGDLSRLGHDVLRVMLAVMAGFITTGFLPIIESVIHAADSMVASTFMSSSKQLTATLSVVIAGGITATLASGGTLVLVAIIFGLLAFASVASLWIVLVIAQGVVYLAGFFAPLALVVSPKLGRKVAELGIAFLLTPFIITSILAVGLAVLADGGSNFGTVIEHTILGIGILFLGCFAPFSVHRMLQAGSAHVAAIRHPSQHGQALAGDLSRAANVGSSASSTGGAAASGAAGASSAAAAVPAAVIAGIRHHTSGAGQVADSSSSDQTSPSPSTPPPAPGSMPPSSSGAGGGSSQTPPQDPTTPGRTATPPQQQDPTTPGATTATPPPPSGPGGPG